MVLADGGQKNGRAKRTPEQREKDLAVTARLILQGKSHAHIAEQLGVSRQQVSLDATLLRKLWKEQALVDSHAFLAKELARTELVEAEAWRGWERSSKEAITKTQ